MSLSFSRIAENRIREAMEQGEFDNLPGAGQPLSLEEYFSTPEELRMAYSILKNANCTPVEVELSNECARLKQAIATAADPAARQEFERALVDVQTRLGILLERRPLGEK